MQPYTTDAAKAVPQETIVAVQEAETEDGDNDGGMGSLAFPGGL